MLSILLSTVQPKTETLPRKTRRGLGAHAMYRARLSWLLSAAVILGALRCSSSEPEPTPAEGLANLHTAAQKATASSCTMCLDIHLDDYNLFLLEDFTYSGTIQGKLAVGGNVTLSGFSLGMEQPDNNVSNTLVAGGNLTLTDGAVAGAARYGGIYTPTRVTYSRGTAAQGTPIDFAARFAELRSLSSRLAAQTPHGTTVSNPWSVTMSGTDPCLNVFTLRASDFAGHGDWTITAPTGSFVLVNITGQAPAYRGGNIRLVGISPQRVLFNFVDATSLTAESFNFQGTVLAPRAHVTIRYTVFSGGLYAHSLVLQGAPANRSPLDEMAGAETEVCNGADDNCNGQADEGFECTGSGSRSCTAWCGAAGTQTCDSATCGYGECTSASCCHADADCSSDSYCAGNTCVERQGNGASCDSSSQCASGQCVDGVCCNTACDGECNACNLAGQEGTCTLAPSTTQCRGSAGACDVAEYCTGGSAACPADAKQPATTPCRGSAGACDVAESCTGTSNDCPADGYASSTIQCRSAEGECDVAEYCNGGSATCPANGAQASGVTCTSDSNPCSIDVCDGTGSCGHPLLPAGTSCGSGQVCDATGQCLSGCWIAGAYYAGGTANPSGDCQVCDPSQSITDWSFKPATTQCRASGGACDVAEYCTGSSAACPADTKQPATTVCRGSAGTCDVAESCTGTGNDCPADGYASSATQCRVSGGECDVAEFCTGSGASCPADGYQASGAACSTDGNACTSDVCDGTGGCGHPQLPAGTACGPWQVCSPAGQCVNANECWIGGIQYAAGATNPNGPCQVCDPSQSASDWSFAPATTQCRGSAGVCDAAEYCTGSSAACPADTKQPATTVCRGSAGTCDVAESCTGTGNDCPADGYASSATQCRAANGVCDVAERCTGTAAACPGDAVAGAGTLCRAASGSCDVAEVCDGTQKSCPGDGYSLPGTSCGTSYGSWSTCGGFSDFCSTSGTQSRTVTNSTCGGAGVCGASSTNTETQACTRPAPDRSCQAPSYGAWSACSFSNACAQTGSRSRTVTSYSFSCASGQCAASTSTETETCTRNTNGNTCGTPTYGGWDSCSGFSDTCDETGIQARMATAYTCSSGQCMAFTNTEFQGCVRSTAGVQCREGNACDYAEYCSGGFCPLDSRVPAGTSCNDGDPGTSGDVCDGNGGCAGEAPSNCPSTTVTWSQPQPAWNGNTGTAGTYVCHGAVPWASHGSTNVPATLTSSDRTGSARFTCSNGTWVVSGASCDGRIITPNTQAGGFPVTCFDSRPTYSLWIGWYVAELKRCPDPAGLEWWVDAYVQNGSNGDAAYWRDALRSGGVAHGDVPENGHVNAYIEYLLCGSLAYPWTNVQSNGASCKYRP